MSFYLNYLDDLDEAYAEGYAEGYAKAYAEKAAVRLLQRGLRLDMIVEAVCLPLDEVRKLQQKHT